MRLVLDRIPGWARRFSWMYRQPDVEELESTANWYLFAALETYRREDMTFSTWAYRKINSGFYEAMRKGIRFPDLSDNIEALAPEAQTIPPTQVLKDFIRTLEEPIRTYWEVRFERGMSHVKASQKASEHGPFNPASIPKTKEQFRTYLNGYHPLP